MKLIRLSELMAYKYKIAASELELKEAEIRRGILDLWNASTGKPYGIYLRDLTSTGLGDEPSFAAKAKPAQEWLIALLNIVDVMKSNLNDIDMDTLREKLKEIIASIESKMAPGLKGTADFPIINDLVFAAAKMRTRFEAEKYKKEMFGKARSGLERLHSMASKLLSKVRIFQGLPSTDDPTKAYRHHQHRRLEPKRNQLSDYEVMPFIRQYGMEYGIRSEQDWAIAFRDDPQFKEDITTVINALNRGKIPRDEVSVKMEIARVIRDHEARMATNAELFNAPEEQAQQALNQLPQEEEWSKMMLEKKKQKQSGEGDEE